MDLSLSESQQLLVDSCHQFFADQCPVELVRASEPTGFNAELWQAFVALGTPLMLVEEAAGGLGLGALDASLVAVEVGRALAPIPFVDTVVCADLLARCEDAQPLLTALESGALRIALYPSAMDCAAEVLVPSGAAANGVIALCGDGLYYCDDESRRRNVGRNLGSGAPAHWALDDSARCLASGEAARELFARALAQWRLFTAAQLVGLSQAALAIGVDYAREREQFGVAIGSYQAIAHPLAECATRVDGAELLVWQTAWADNNDRLRFEMLADMALVFAGESAEQTAAVSLHTHGGYGFTEEYDIQLYYRRAAAWTLLAGGREAGLQRLAARLHDTHSRGERCHGF